MSPTERYAAVVDALSREPNVTRETRRGFGSGALKARGKIFAMLASGDAFVVKLPKQRVDELVAAGQGTRFEPGPGRVMQEWFVAGSPRLDWVALAREGYAFVGSAAPVRKRAR